MTLTVLEALNRGYTIDSEGNLIRDGSLIENNNVSNRGYKKFTFRINGKQSTCFHHMICAYQKYGCIALSEDICIRHKNGNKLDNRPDNVLIGSYSDNMNDIPKELFDRHIPRLKRQAKKLRSLSDSQAKQLLIDRENGMKYKELMEKYGIAKSTISYIVNRKTYGGVTEK